MTDRNLAIAESAYAMLLNAQQNPVPSHPTWLRSQSENPEYRQIFS